MKKINKNKPIIIVGICLIAWMTTFFNSSALSVVENSDTMVIEVLPLTMQDVDIASKYVGYVVPIKSVEVMANVSGYIDEIWAEGGNKVEYGDNLLLIDQRQYKADVEAMRASKSMAYADFVNAKNYYNRIKKAGKKAVSPSQIDEAKAQFLSAEAKLKQADAELKKAEVVLDYTVLQASISGVLGDVSLTKGNFVAAGQTKLFDIIQQNPIRVKFAISNKDYINNSDDKNQPFANSKIKLKLADNSTYQYTGKFAYIDNQIEKQTASLTVFADFENPDNKLLANSYVDVTLEKKLNDVFLIKQNYVKLENEGAFANVIKNNTLRKEKLNIVGYLDDAYVVNNKFAKNDFLVIGNINNINKNTKLKIKLVSSNAENK